MNGFDVVLLFLLLVPSALGLWRGLLQPAAGLLGLVLGGWLGLQGARPLAAAWFSWGDSQGWAELLVFGLLFVGTILAVALLARAVDSLLRETGLKWMDRAAGLLLGLGVGALAAGVFVVAAAALLPDESRALESSLLAPRVVSAVQRADVLLPEDLRERFHQRLEALAGDGEPDPGSEAAP